MTKFVAVLSENAIISRTASTTGNDAPSLKCAVKMPLPGTLSSFFKTIGSVSFSLPSCAC